MDIIGKTSIHPVLFYSGKIAGYMLWGLLIVHYCNNSFLANTPIPYSQTVSFIVFAIGVVFVVLSLINLGSATRLGLPTEATVFKTNGLYRISRNPMYVGFNLFTIAAVVGVFCIPVLVTALYSIVIYHLIIRGEERFLENRFGSTYLDYKKRIRRYL